LFCFIDVLPRESILAWGVCGNSGRSDQLLQVRQRRETNLRRAGSHIGANDRIQHPARNRNDHARGAFHLEKLASCPLLYPPNIDASAKIGMPRIMNLPIFADMGRMNGR
jgi:hypothetical protein